MSSTMCTARSFVWEKDGQKDEGMSESKRNIEIRSIYLNCYLMLNILFYLDFLLFYHPFFDRTLWLRHKSDIRGTFLRYGMKGTAIKVRDREVTARP